MVDLKPKDLKMEPRKAEIHAAGYADGLSSKTPRHPGSPTYMAGWEDGYAELCAECESETGEKPND